MLLAFGVTALLALALMKLTSEIVEGETSALDIAMLRAIRDETLGHGILKDGLRAIMLGLTAIGDTAPLTGLVAMVAGLLAMTGRGRQAAMLCVQTLSGALLVSIIKALVDRPRPAIVPYLASFNQASFPSGHAANSTIIFLAIGLLIAAAAKDRRRKLAVMIVASTLAFLVGISRLYVGVHWPTDVLGGWALGAGWTVLFWAVGAHARGAVKAMSASAVYRD